MRIVISYETFSHKWMLMPHFLIDWIKINIKIQNNISFDKKLEIMCITTFTEFKITLYSCIFRENEKKSDSFTVTDFKWSFVLVDFSKTMKNNEFSQYFEVGSYWYFCALYNR